MDDEQAARIDLEEAGGRRDRAAGLVHVRLGLEQRRNPAPSRTSDSCPENFERNEPPCRRASSSTTSQPTLCRVSSYSRPGFPGRRRAGRASRTVRPDGEGAPTPLGFFEARPRPRRALRPRRGGGSSPSAASSSSPSSSSSSSGSGSTIWVGTVTVAMTVSSGSSRNVALRNDDLGDAACRPSASP